VWNRQYIESMQLTMAEKFGIQGRGAFYDSVGAIRDVVQNHLMQLLSNIAMEPPPLPTVEALRDERVKVLKSTQTLRPEDVVLGQFKGYHDEPGVKPGSPVETYAALRVHINSWRWRGVPFYIRTGKSLPLTATEVVARFHTTPPVFSEEVPPQNYMRFRISPEMTIAMSVSVATDLGDHDRESVELVASRHPSSEEMEAYERVLTDAMAGDATLFARQDYVEEAWRIVDPVLKAGTPVYEYDKGTWGPGEVQKVSPAGGWQNPIAADQEDFRVAAQAD